MREWKKLKVANRAPIELSKWDPRQHPQIRISRLRRVQGAPCIRAAHLEQVLQELKLQLSTEIHLQPRWLSRIKHLLRRLNLKDLWLAKQEYQWVAWQVIVLSSEIGAEAKVKRNMRRCMPKLIFSTDNSSKMSVNGWRRRKSWKVCWPSILVLREQNTKLITHSIKWG